MVAILCGGGIDTVLSMAYVNNSNIDVKTPIYFDLNHKYAKTEIKHLLKFIPNIIIDNSLKGLGVLEDVDAFIPSRNVHLIISGFRYSNEIVIGTTVDDNVNDQTRNLFDKLEGVAKELGVPDPKIHTPFLDDKLGKIEALNMYKDHDRVEESIKNCFSCFHPINDKSCNSCPACFRKNCVTNYVYKTRTIFNNPIIVRQYLAKAKREEYSTMRCLSIIDYVDSL